MRCYLVGLLVVVAASALFADHCSPYTTCEQCVKQSLCGWCSFPVVYPGNITGAQCAGFSPNGSTPFACNGIYSTDQCVVGYVCDESTFTCKLGAPGQGNTLARCEANCTNKGQVYLCNTTTKQCYQVPRGTPGSSSLSVCTASCMHPSPHPATPVPPPPTLYKCNFTTGKCQTAPAGQGTSLQVCEESCKQQNQTMYLCNKFLQQCIKLPPGVPGGESLAACEQECHPKPQPGPPSQLTGLWRGIRIDNQYVIGEFDLSINETTVVFVGKIMGSEISTIIGKPMHIPNSPQLEMWIDVQSGPGSGKIIKTIGNQGGANGPETKYATIAMSLPGGAVPQSIDSAMQSSVEWVFAMGACISQSCIFSLRTPPRAPRLTDSDHCTPYGDSCQDCLAHQFCGWCSVNVTYKDGTKGSQCAGFNGPNGTNAFVCAGRYSTLSCNAGYLCNYTSLQCYETTPGDGAPKDVCEALCRPTPPPPPPQKQYTCNVTEKKCFPCNTTHCPGSMPLGQCEAACTNPKPGPHGNLIGVWRGIRIMNAYTVGEVEMVFTNTSVTYYKAGVMQFKGTVTSLGADLMLIDVTEGKHKGWRFSVVYQSSTQANGLYDYITFARSKPDGPTPNSYDEAMYTAGMAEYIMAKCDGGVCKFRSP